MFTPDTLDFLEKNRFTNSSVWFSEHKSDYTKYVLEPMSELVLNLAPVLETIDKQIDSEPRVDHTISRIRRDTRFIRDGMIFREEMWLTFKRNKRQYPSFPEFYFVFSPLEVIYGCGYYNMKPSTAESIHRLIIEGDKDFNKARKCVEKNPVFTLEGQNYKRSRFPDRCENERQWLDKKSICVQSRATPEILFEKDLAERISRDFSMLKPVYDFFLKAELTISAE